ncbi:HAD family hydrolase [Segetibacter aerophilus]|uniref:Beta-phosphoglucomutase n=1 Tax=Segetibacter aerophilus TaxID=670293 RepID=A0A512BJX9_9BACT|nr:HAD family phosphatase [Segetibacter aerophilus]GEO12195.1 beta-phosphoglucomutase [Segetibacter aerophilus]
MIKAILFDLNGTMIDDMEYHARAWSTILNNDLNANLTMDQVRKEMYGKNSEVLIRVFGEGKFSAQEMDKLSIEKEKRYQKEFFPELRLINGLDQFLKAAQDKSIGMAIASAAIPFNIDFVLDNLHLREYFAAIVSADDVATSKPHPETFLKAANLLNTLPEDCIVFEDAPKGVEAAQNAGMKTVVLTTMHEKEEFAQYNNIVAFVKDYSDPFFTDLLNDAKQL